ncbi:MAG: hypothetical protein MI923_10390 [Phycisphaerales bacterium]|nr:hypothetical protein [Phycisphaerales bacterium]
MRRLHLVLALFLTLAGTLETLAQTRSTRGRDRVLPSQRHRMRGSYSETGDSRLSGILSRSRRTPYGIRSSDRERRTTSEGYSFERKFDLLRPIQPFASPIVRDLNRRNLLRSRSPLGRRSASFIGRRYYGMEPDRRSPGDLDIPPPSPTVTKIESDTEGRSYTDLLVARLRKKADDYFDLGITYFREKEYLKSRQHFELAQQVDQDHPRTYLAKMIVSFQRGDLNIAIVSLKHGIDRAESLDDLRIDWKRFYATEQEFQRLVDSASLLANSPKVSPGVKLLLAYYTWLNGDLQTAISVAESAERQAEADRKASSTEQTNLVDEARGDKKRFSQLLIEARDRPQVSTTGDQN